MAQLGLPRLLAAVQPRIFLPRKSFFFSRSYARRKKSSSSSSSSSSKALPDLLQRQLRDVALLCGRNTAGTKAVLCADLQAAAQTMTSDSSSTDRRVLSVDMGVRNLAFCLLHVGSHETVPKLLAWERLSLIDDNDTAAEEEEQTPPPAGSPFSPPAMASVAARLVYDRLLPLQPTHIIIERQRFRSGGAAAVLEWTVRVNSLEAILHGILAARQLFHASDDDDALLQSIEAVSPRRVSQFVVRGGLTTGRPSLSLPLPLPELSKAKKEKDIKDVKEALIASILRSNAASSHGLLTYDADSSVGDMVNAYLTRWDAKQTRSRKKSKVAQPTLRLTKIDDLADCVTQGLVWLEWETNLRMLAKDGAEALLTAKLPA